MTTLSAAKRIRFNAADQDYSAYYDGELIGIFATYTQAEIELDAHALDLLERGLIDSAEGITTMRWQTPRDVVLARPAEVAEVVEVKAAPVVVPNPGFHLLSYTVYDRAGQSTGSYAVDLCDDCAAKRRANGTMGAKWSGECINGYCDDCQGGPSVPHFRLVESALPSAPGADAIETTSDASPLPSARQETAHPDATQPAASDLNCGCLDPSICWCGAHPQDDVAKEVYRDLNIRYTAESIAIEALTQTVTPDPVAALATPDILRRRALALLDAWKECGVADPLLDRAFAQLHAALTCEKCGAPASAESTLLIERPLCDACGNAAAERLWNFISYTGPRCPDCADPVAVAGRCAACQEDAGQTIDGQRIWDAYRDRTLAPVLRDADPEARQRMAAAAQFLADRWGRAVPAGAVLNNFEWLIRNSNAAPAS